MPTKKTPSKLPNGHPQKRQKRKVAATHATPYAVVWGQIDSEAVERMKAEAIRLDALDNPATGEYQVPLDAMPWPIRLVWWLDGVPARVRKSLAFQLRRLAAWVYP